MTDKEIIEIDGINVLECEHYQYKSLKDCEMRYPESGDCEIGLLNYLFDGNLDMEKSCKDNPNCDFKQLARKTQECEELKNEYWKLEQGNDFLAEKNSRLKGCLAEIKEIAEPFCNACQEFEPEKKGSNCMYCNYGKILQKISECEVNND